MNLNTNDNCVVNVDALGKDPEEDKKLMYLLKMQTFRKNIIPLAEFNMKFAPLFQKVKDMDQQELRQLSNTYMMRIDPYHPVYIVNDVSYPTVEELLKDDNVVMILPAIYNRLGTVNDVKSKDGKDIGLEKMLAFNNLAALDIADPFDRKKIRYSQELGMIVNAMTDPAILQRNKEKAQEMAKQALAPRELKEQSTSEDIPDDILQEYQTASEEVEPITTEHEEFL